MKYEDIVDCDFNNGEGARVSLWVTGCPHACKGCHNYELWDSKKGKLFTASTKIALFGLLSDKHISGLSILGGEPLAEYNIEDILYICKAAKQKFPEKDIWLWTGYELSEFEIERFKDIDVIIDGKYDMNLPTSKLWRGSDNQKMWKNNGNGFTLID